MQNQILLFGGIFLVLAFSSQAQDTSDDTSISNPSEHIQTCSSSSCISQINNSALCSPENDGVGLGTISQGLNLSSSTTLSLTLVDGAPAGKYANSQEAYSFSTLTLYVGVPDESTNLPDQPEGCGLMLQHQATTFPYYSQSENDINSTTCPQDFLYDGNALRDLSHYIQDFGSSNSSNSSNLVGTRCEQLADYLSGRIHAQLSFGAYYAALVNVVGGTLSGPDVNTNIAQTLPRQSGSEAGCPSSSTYQLHNVTSVTQILRGNPVEQNSTFGGRTGYTPVISVVYGEDGAESPDVQVFCMHLYQTDGEELPYSTLTSTSSAAESTSWSRWSVLVALVLSMVW